MNITVTLEYAPGKLVLGLDEPGFLLADKKSAHSKPKFINARPDTGTFAEYEGAEEMKDGEKTTLVMVDDLQI